MKKNKNHITSHIKKNIEEIDPDAIVMLFGFRARGDERDDSDWDILILTDYPVTFETEQKFRHHLFELELELGQVFSTFVFSKAEWEMKHSVAPFYQSVSQEGILL